MHERNQTNAETFDTCLVAALASSSPLPISTSCLMCLRQFVESGTNLTEGVCVQDCVGNVCTFFEKFGNETLIGMCSDPLVNGCRDLNRPVMCAGSVAAVVPALLGMAALLSALFGLFYS